MKDVIVLGLGLIGFIMIAGSAGDCDGHCMEQANTMGEMLMLIAGGFAFMVVASLIHKNKD